MAEAIVSFLIDQLASMAVERIKEEVSLVKNCKSDVKKLKSNLEVIQAVLEDAEKKQLTELNVKLWLEKLKEASFEIDNVLDEWNTSILKLMIQKESGGEEDEDVDDQKAVKNKKIWTSFPSPLSCCGAKGNHLALRHDIAHKIKDLNQTLADLASEKDQFKLSTTVAEMAVERPRTTSFIDETEVEGRDVEKKILVSKLLGKNSVQKDQGPVQIIPIVGLGGLGKTTLAQLVFNDDMVKAHFDLRIWVCVSHPFDEVKIARAIIESDKDYASLSNGIELQTLLQSVCECLRGKRFLLVLDDVWTKESDKWDQLKQPLKCGAAGSKIVVTTRTEEVAIMMGATKHVMMLEKLSEESCWSVFSQRAFSERNDDERHQLQDVGRRIANKSKGLPLVAKSLGSLMRFKKTISQWQDVLDSDLWSSMNVKKIFTPFLLGYHDLPAQEKACFSYCSVFPKDEEIYRDQVIKMWMSQNYIRDEKEGLECFENLAMRSFFQDFGRGVDGSIIQCKMHDTVHDFAQYLRGSECFKMEVHSDGRELNLPDEKSHHLTLALHAGGEAPSLDLSKSCLRTLLVLRSNESAIVDCSLFLQLICLRSLTLARCGIKKLPTSIGDMKHLRYLNLGSNHELEELPESLCDLCNLQTLYLQYCRKLRELPKGIGKLISLRHLLLLACDTLEGLPKGIVNLKSLRNLDTLFVSEHKDMLFEFGDLKRFPNLRLEGELFIKDCKNLGIKDDGVKQLDLKNISQHCETLTLDFGQWRGRVNLDEESDILEGLEPHPKLQVLTIQLYKGSTPPRWVASLINLTHIVLNACDFCQMLPSLGKLPNLQVIVFRGLLCVTTVGIEFLGLGESDSAVTLFPRLTHLVFTDMQHWKTWDGIDTAISSGSIRIMPFLAELKIFRCPSLQVLPEFLKTVTSLQELEIRSPVGKWCRKRSGNEWDKICHVPNIILDKEYVKKDGIWIEEL